MEQSVNERVKMLRSHLAISQQDFATRLKKTTTTISRLESGLANPRISTLKLICQEFGVSKEWLIDGIGELEITDPRPVEKQASWKEKAFEVMEKQNEHLSKEVLFLRSLLTNITGQTSANFDTAFNLVA